jgi:hypothetical protein
MLRPRHRLPGQALARPVSVAVTAGMSPSRWASWTVQAAAYGVAAADHVRRDITRVGVDVSASGGRAVLRQADRWFSAGLPFAVETVLSRIDLTELVAEHVDIDRLVTTVDLDAAAHQLDLLGLAQYIIDGVDLPAIVRSSSAGMTSEAVHGLRRNGVKADQAVARAVDRFVPRRRSSNGDARRAPQLRPEPLG